MRDPFRITQAAQRRLPRMMFDFISGGTGGETAQHAIRQAFDAVKLQPRVLRNVEGVTLQTAVLGSNFGRPYGIAPMGMCNLIAPNADHALSEQAATRNIPHCVSTAASTTIEQSALSSDGAAWFQLYAGTNTDLTTELVNRAKDAGYTRLVFTVDTPRHARRVRDLDNGFRVPLRWGPRQILDVATHPRWALAMARSGPPKPMNYHTSKVQRAFQREDSRGASDWDVLRRLRDQWPRQLIVKGVTSPEDASAIQDVGCDAVYVSNHGGRQLDSGLPALMALPDVRAAVGPTFPVIFDSGIRSADDVVRALACGADFVMLGRPMLYALGAGGRSGLVRSLDRLDEDIKSVMAQIGVTRVSDIGPNVLARAHPLQVAPLEANDATPGQ